MSKTSTQKHNELMSILQRIAEALEGLAGLIDSRKG